MKNTLRHLTILLLALPLPALAACAQCACTASATGVAFGTYNPFSGLNADDTGSVRISCMGGPGAAAYSIQLSRGLYGAGFGSRRMGSGGNRLNYDLYTDPAHTTVWGDGSGGSGFVSDSLSVLLAGSARNYPVYGRIFARQRYAAVGAYTDTITITVTYQ